MGYYDDDYEYFDYEMNDEELSLVAHNCSDKDVTDVLVGTSLIINKPPRLNCSMEKLVFMYGVENEVYSPQEIKFTEQVDKVFVYEDAYKNMNSGKMPYRIVATRLNCTDGEAVKQCIAFEKVINKALEGFNIFFFVTEDSLYFGCKVFDKLGKHDCDLSAPICSDIELEQFQEEFMFTVSSDDFAVFYNQFRTAITRPKEEEDFEDFIVRRRGIQMSYLEEIIEIERDLRINMSSEKDRYCQQFEDENHTQFDDLVLEVEESLSFIKSNRINTYEMLFEADEMERNAEAAEAERLEAKKSYEDTGDAVVYEQETENMLNDPEEMIRLLKKKRGIK